MSGHIGHLGPYSQTHQEVFPFTSERVELGPGNVAKVGFGALPHALRSRLCAPNKETALRPVIVSLSFIEIGTQPAHEVRIELVEQPLGERDYRGGETVDGERWRQVLFAARRVRYVYGACIPVPVAQSNGNPFAVEVTTRGRRGPSMLVMDWQWSRWTAERPFWRSGR